MIVLVGFMGAGKTSVGRAVAARLGLPFVDIDERIEAAAGQEIPQIFAIGGEPAFRALEEAVVKETLGGGDAVVALGGGSIEAADIPALLEDADVVYLRVTVEEALRRVGDPSLRPMLARHDPAQLLSRRAPLYEAIADVTVEVDGRSLEQVVDDVVRAVATAEESPA